MGRRIFIVAGDRSGDIHAARLMHALREREPAVEFVGIGGPSMVEAGLQTIVPFETMNVSGFWEVLRRMGTLRGVLDMTKEYAQATWFDAFIPVDYPGFNLQLARWFRARGIPVLWYIAPQLWAWGAWRARRLVEAVDRLFVVFPFEVEFFQRAGIETEWYGHPLLDNPAYAQEPTGAKNPNLVALLPGTRPHERKLHLPLLLNVASQLRQRYQHLQFVVATARPASMPATPWLQFTTNVEQLLLEAHLAVIKAGTSTLESLLAGTPQVVIYRASLGTYLVGRMLVRIPFVALPNIIAGQKIIPEVVQWSGNIRRIEQQVEGLLANSEEQERQRNAARHIRSLLGGSGASQRIADRMLELLGRR
jgi:lipid-A-disaccharide synthase